MADSEAKEAWMARNTVLAATRLNRNQNPELCRLLDGASSKGALMRDLMEAGAVALGLIPPGSK